MILREDASRSTLVQSLYSVTGDFFMILRLFKGLVLKLKKPEKQRKHSMWLNEDICMDDTNQYGTNTCHHNKKLNQILNHLHLFGDFPKSLINEYCDYILYECNSLFLACNSILVSHIWSSKEQWMGRTEPTTSYRWASWVWEMTSWKLKTSRTLPILVEESIEHTSNE